MTLDLTICQVAARCIVEEGLDYATAKKRAAQELGLKRNIPWPPHQDIEDAVREHIALFCPATQPLELLALRRLAAHWMTRLQPLRPYLSGAVWRGTATLLNDIHLDLYCDDSKQAELMLLNEKITFHTSSSSQPGRPPLDVLSLSSPCPPLPNHVSIHLFIYDFDDLRGALKPDPRGQTWRGDLAALEGLLSDPSLSGVNAA